MRNFQLSVSQLAILIFLGITFVSCQQNLVQIQPAGVSYLTLYTKLVQDCLIVPSLCNQYDSNDIDCQNGVSFFQTCLANKCYPAQAYKNSPLYQENYINYSLFMSSCAQVCYGNAFSESANPNSPSLIQSLKTLLSCYIQNEVDVYAPDYYKFFFQNYWQKCSISNLNCVKDQTFLQNNEQIEKFVQTCVQETPIYITNTAYVYDIGLNQTSTCIINAFNNFQIDYTNNKCFQQIQNCGDFQILQKVSSILIQACFFSILIGFFAF